MKILSVVCARGGSKGFKNKCITQIKDKMVVEYSIDYSLSLGKEVKTVVSTDSKELISHCKKNNIKYIIRDPGLCADDSEIFGVLADAIEKQGQGCEYCSLVYGNIPIRYPGLFCKAWELLKEDRDLDAVISMQNVGKFHPEWMFDYAEDVLPERKKGSHQRQILPQLMIHDGHTLIFKAHEFMDRFKGLLPVGSGQYSIYGDIIKPLTNKELIIDIDTKKDFVLAEAVIASNEYKKRELK